MLITTFGFAGSPSSPSFVRVELRVERGILFRLSGVSHSSARSAQARIRSALIACGYRWPGKGITVNIAPASRERKSTAYDLPIALAILAAEGNIPAKAISNLASAGELGLDGSIRLWNTNPFLHNEGTPHLECLRTVNRIIAPDGAIDDNLIANISAVNHLKKLIALLNQPTTNRREKSLIESIKLPTKMSKVIVFDDLAGEPTAKRKAVLAAAGNHNIIMMGPPGSGKTELAKCIHSLLPDLSDEEQYEVNKINRRSKERLNRPPWRAPHVSTGAAGLIGSWSPRTGVGVIPGEWSLAHKGILFLDEWSEFTRSALEACRIPMETGIIALARAAGSIELPAKALLIAALNPCPCGRFTDEFGGCFCSSSEVKSYLKKLSGPVADRFSIHIELGNERHLTRKEGESEYFKHIVSESDIKPVDNAHKRIKSELLDEIHKNLKLNEIVNRLKYHTFKQFGSFLKSNRTLLRHNWRLFMEKSSFKKWIIEINGDFIKNDEIGYSSIISAENIHLLLESGLESLFIDDKRKTEWELIRSKVASTREWRQENDIRLDLSTESKQWLSSFMAISSLSERGRNHVLDVAETAALIDGQELINFNHIVEAAEGRLFDRSSWLSGANEGVIPEYRKELIPKFELCTNNIL
jgi:magnesium chelatase family protein